MSDASAPRDCPRFRTRSCLKPAELDTLTPGSRDLVTNARLCLSKCLWLFAGKLRQKYLQPCIRLRHHTCRSLHLNLDLDLDFDLNPSPDRELFAELCQLSFR